MSSHDVTVCAVNWGALEYLRFLDFTLRRLADRPTFQWLVCETTPHAAQAARLEEALQARVITRDLGRLRGSAAHGTGLNALLPYLQTPYTLFVDPDCAVLAPGWDTLCKRALQEEDVVAVGAPYAGPVQKHRYGDFPIVTLLMCRTEFLQRHAVDFRPDWATWHGACRRTLRRCVGLFDADRDTGWQLRKTVHTHGFRGICFQWLNQHSAEAVVLSHGERGSEYHWNGRPFASHQGRSGVRAPFQGEVSAQWFLAVCRYLRLDPFAVSEQLQLCVNTAWLERRPDPLMADAA